MTKRAELEVVIKNPEAAESFFERTSRAITEMGKAGKTAFGEMAKESGKVIATGLSAAVAAQTAELIGTITKPMRTSFSEAIDKAEQFRMTVTRAALATGQDFQKTQKEIESTSKRVGEMPEAVLSFSKTVEATTGYWLQGSQAVDAYKDRALALHKELGEMAGSASQLSNVFNLRDGDKITAFFGTLTAQSEKLGINAKTASLQFEQMAQTMARMTSASPEKLSAVSSSFLKAAGGNKEQASVIQQGVMSFLKSRLPYIEDEMRASGKIGKNESIVGKDGRVREDLLLPILSSQQAYLKKNFGKMPWREQMRILGQGDVFGSAEAAAGFLNLDTQAMEAAAKLTAPSKPSLLPQFLRSDAGKALLGQIKKDEKDREVGNTFLPAKDRMVGYGGGWKGVGMDTVVKAGAGAVVYKAGQKLLSGVVGKIGEKATTEVLKNTATSGASSFFEKTAALATGQVAKQVATKGVSRGFFSSIGKGLSVGGRTVLGKAGGLFGGVLLDAALNPGIVNSNEEQILAEFRKKEAEATKQFHALPQADQKKILKKRSEEEAERRKEYEKNERPEAFKLITQELRHNKNRHWYSGLMGDRSLVQDNPEALQYQATFLKPEDLRALAQEFGKEMMSKTLKVAIEPDSKPLQGERNHP